MVFRLIPTSMTLNDIGRRNSPYFAFFHRIWLLCWPIRSRMWVACKSVWSLCYTWAVSEHFRDKGLIIKRCINLSVYFTLLQKFPGSNFPGDIRELSGVNVDWHFPGIPPKNSPGHFPCKKFPQMIVRVHVLDVVHVSLKSRNQSYLSLRRNLACQSCP